MRLTGRLLEPIPGTVRFKRKFAWLPTKAGGTLIWLERYNVMEAFLVTTALVNIEQEQVTVKFGEWKKVSTRLINK